MKEGILCLPESQHHCAFLTVFNLLQMSLLLLKLAKVIHDIIT